ncbi:hypothetical protein FIBSPDRAFT_881428 [Athelia psychrophila]|uniref:Uncharacterized protein n=1 Tax=Athelia psychrophila TaxID=1759441 RepID=A0A166WNM2_9AGAM|nr:hypothetical protein FIBSPDRAFT_881428 [Fibularhizoctonia sp. CBS 109695]
MYDTIWGSYLCRVVFPHKVTIITPKLSVRAVGLTLRRTVVSGRPRPVQFFPTLVTMDRSVLKRKRHIQYMVHNRNRRVRRLYRVNREGTRTLRDVGDERVYEGDSIAFVLVRLDEGGTSTARDTISVVDCRPVDEEDLVEDRLGVRHTKTGRSLFIGLPKSHRYRPVLHRPLVRVTPYPTGLPTLSFPKSCLTPRATGLTWTPSLNLGVTDRSTILSSHRDGIFVGINCGSGDCHGTKGVIAD